jgi:uncharacterized SAM-binding protein YcdF (DUF218 family)
VEILFLLKKTIGFLIQPYGLILSLFLFTIVFFIFGKKFLARLSFVFGFLLFIAFSNPFVANFLSSNLENIHPKYLGQQASFITTLGNGHYENNLAPTSSSLSSAGTKRVLEAVMIYHQMADNLKKPKIIFTGYSGFNNKKTYAQMAANFAKKLQVNPNDIIISGTEKDTDDEAKTIKKIVKNHQVILVTSAMHMPRSVDLFKKYDINTIPAPTDFKTDNRGVFSKPSFSSLQQSNLAIHEYVGILWNSLVAKIKH